MAPGPLALLLLYWISRDMGLARSTPWQGHVLPNRVHPGLLIAFFSLQLPSASVCSPDSDVETRHIPHDRKIHLHGRSRLRKHRQDSLGAREDDGGQESTQSTEEREPRALSADSGPQCGDRNGASPTCPVDRVPAGGGHVRLFVAVWARAHARSCVCVCARAWVCVCACASAGACVRVCMPAQLANTAHLGTRLPEGRLTSCTRLHLRQ